jgi:hypothetical protein
MAASITSSIAALILKVDDPNRDDLTSVKVWASTTNGFTPDNTNLVYTGNSFTIIIPNLTPLTTYYVKYAYISEIDPTNYDFSSQLSGIPNKIAGSIIVDDSITASQISADGIRGKYLLGGFVADYGTTCTATVVAQSTPLVTTTINALNTVDFPSTGAAYVLNGTTGWWTTFRYTGKTATSFTGASGLYYGVNAGDLIVPYPNPSAMWQLYDGTPDFLPISGATDFVWRSGSGSGIAISTSDVADVFTYTAGEVVDSVDPTVYYPYLQGISSLANWTIGTQTNKTLIDNRGFATSTIATSGSFLTLTVAANNEFLNPTGGYLLLVSETIVGSIKVRYISYSGTVVTFEYEQYLDAATYYLIPQYSNTVVGIDGVPFVNLNNMNSVSSWTFTTLSVNTDSIQTSLSDVGISNGLSVTGNTKSHPDNATPPLSIIQPSNTTAGFPTYALLGINFSGNTFFNALDYDGHAYSSGLWLGVSYVDMTGSGDLINVLSGYQITTAGSPSTFTQYQPISTTLRFSNYGDASVNSINWTGTTYNFNTNNGSRNANIQANHIALGSATASASIVISAVETFTINAARYGSQNQITFSNATLTADRLLYAAYNASSLTYQNSTAFSANSYGSWNQTSTSTTGGNSVDGVGQIFGSYNYALHQSDSATYNKIENAFGSYNYAYSSGDTSVIDNAYGVYSNVRTGGTSASASVGITNAYGYYGLINAASVNRNITNAYLMYLTTLETGTVTTKWGIYVNSPWNNYFAGKVLIGTAIETVGGANLQISNGITFPATAVDSANANTLDDYEEGTFTPTISGSTTAGAGTYTTRNGKYTKIGNRVSFGIYLVWTAHTGTGNILLSGLPFTVSDNTYPAVSIYTSGLTLTANSYPIGYVDTGGTSILLRQTVTGTSNPLTIPIDTAATIFVSGHYTV